MKKIACLLPVYRRPEITIATINYLKKQTHPVEIFIVGDSYIEEDIANDTNVNFIKHPNLPLSKKMQYGINQIRKYNPDGILICGSDSWITTTWVEKFCPYLNKYDLIGKSVFYTLEVNKNSNARILGRGYNQIWAPVGTGRIISKRILDKIDWKAYIGIKNTGLDTLCLKNITKAGGRLKVFIETQHPDEIVLSLKSNSWDVLTPFEKIKKSKNLRKLPDIENINLWLKRFFPGQIEELKKIVTGCNFSKSDTIKLEDEEELITKIQVQNPLTKLKNDKINVLLISFKKNRHMSILFKNLKNSSENINSILLSSYEVDFLSSILCNKFYNLSQVPKKDINSSIIEIIKKEQINAIIPSGITEAIICKDIEKNIPKITTCRIMSSDIEVLKILNNKYSLFRELSKNEKIKIPKYYICNNYDDLINKVKELGYPKKKIFVRVLTSEKINFILDSGSDSFDLLRSNFDIPFISLNKFINLFPEKNHNFKFFINEYIEGVLNRSTCLSYEGNMVGIITKEINKKSELNKFVNTTEINEICLETCNSLDISFINCVETINNYVINVTYDIDKFIYSNELNEGILALKLLMNELDFNFMNEYKKILKNLNYSIYSDLVTFKM